MPRKPINNYTKDTSQSYICNYIFILEKNLPHDSLITIFSSAFNMHSSLQIFYLHLLTHPYPIHIVKFKFMQRSLLGCFFFFFHPNGTSLPLERVAPYLVVALRCLTQSHLHQGSGHPCPQAKPGGTLCH